VNSNPARSWGAAELFLGTLTAYAPRNSLLEIRYRVEDRPFSRFFVHASAQGIWPDPVGSVRSLWELRWPC
jgi:hypothetical protein